MLRPANAVSDSSLTTRIVQRVLEAAERGEYRRSERLPSERELAEQLAVSRNTVTAAYAELEQRGVLRRIHGKGAYLCALHASEESFSWSGKVSPLANALDEPVLELLARRCADTISYPFSAGTPSLEAFSKERYRASILRVLDEQVPAALAIAPAEGQWRLRAAIGGWLGIQPQNIMITAGAQEGIDLAARCLIEPGDFVVIDAPAYPGALQSFLSAGARLLSWGTEWSLRLLEKLLLRYRPKLIFTTPTFQNPTGRVMTRKVRAGLLSLAAKYRVPIIEDDVYGRTHFGGHPMPDSLYRLDVRSQVISINTFSKMLAPGLRVGWLAAPLYMVKQLSLIKMRSNLFTGGLNQLALADMIAGGQFEDHLQELRACHRELCRAAIAALEPAAQQGLLQYRVPAGGLYLWCRVLPAMDMDLLFSALEEEGVSVAPGMAFEPERQGRASPHFRLCFTAVSRERLVEGIGILNRLLCRLLRDACMPAASAAGMPLEAGRYSDGKGM